MDHARALSILRDVAARIPAGRVATHGAISRHLGVHPSLVAAAFKQLTDRDRAAVAWWRIVADGGALGWHPWRAAQMERLRGDGLAVAPAGIVQDVAARRIDDIAALLRGQVRPRDEPPPVPPPSRVRGMKGRPTSSV